MESSDYENISMSIYSQTEEGASQKNKSPLRDLGNILDNSHAEGSKSGVAMNANDYRKLERLYGDSIIRINDLVRHLERAESELMDKEKQLDLHLRKIHELSMDNKTITNELKQERELHDKEYLNWTETREKLEKKIDQLNQTLHNLLQNNKSLEQIQTDNISLHVDDLSRSKLEVDKLTKKITILEKENQLEAHSKILIIEELEMLKVRFSELEERYEKLKDEYAELLAELSMDSTSDIRMNEASDIITDDLKATLAEELQELGINTVAGSRKSSRQTSLNILNNIERDSIERKYSQELTKMSFQMKSLELQNEKLHSYIGFLLQHIPREEADGVAIYKDQLDYEYSDEINILNAKKTLRKVIRSASALPIRPQTYNSTHFNLDALEGRFGRRSSFSEMLERKHRLSYNTNTSLSDQDNIFDSSHQAEDVEYVELGDSDFTISEEDFEEEALDNNESLNVSFTVDLTPSLNIKKRKKSKLFKRTPKKQIEKLTIFGSPSSGDRCSTLVGRPSLKALRKYASSLELIGEDEKEDEHKENYDNILYDCPRCKDDDFARIEVTAEELNLFRLQFRKLLCPKHFIIQCCCDENNLSGPQIIRRLLYVLSLPTNSQKVPESEVFEID
ncbi:hypothetical protein KL925_002931 [Ogataea polymorpha]|uniref:Uncharacterized protein n=1 Tax=Ogataea polymorpha TaxID=460523 RepID=A0A1B7SD77_9ASCO|nr:uncharacterized protein OGAPODRAFT_17189 [Ogataea polymorpha]KAG7880783.1 hypothetical protein KL937_001630 [Ogataea polymorpha]KAG7893524.1 hypothetical protein KL908_002578 [Ogataea polymorpha]KAG7901146.1 hypothetical protein KL935_002212 [Ogataea polymorpha]KAG7905499.1 hypothetical protein KL907_002646 [Ogataea polymorpha]KAG7909401.1 hypothetical protein KL906_002157 [Ogataea polymorpha]